MIHWFASDACLRHSRAGNRATAMRTVTLLSVAGALWACSGAEGAAAPRTESVQGTLQGYFLTPQGDLAPRALSLVTHPGKPREAVHPVPSGYYLSIRARSSTSPILRAEVRTLRRCAPLLCVPVDRPAGEVRLPQGRGAWLGVRLEEGLAFRVMLHLADGRRTATILRPDGIRLLPLPPLRVNWLDFVRIEEARRLLRVVGDDVLPGLRADTVPFMLMGEGDQCVLVDHPRPPRGFRRYRGPCPVRGRVYVGRMRAGSSPSMSMLAGVPTAVLTYDPEWYALPEAPGAKRDDDEAALRLEIVLHEACHADWARRAREDQSSERMELSLRGAAIEEAEIDVLRDATQCLGFDEGRLASLVQDYLALRECRSAVDPASASTQRREASEGFAYFAPWRIAELADGRWEYTLLKRADPFFDGFVCRDPLEALSPDGRLRGTGLPELYLTQYLSYQGACQARLLAALDPGAVRTAWGERGLLLQALRRAAGYEGLSGPEHERLKSEALARWQCRERERVMADTLRQGQAEQWRAAASASNQSGAVLRVRAELLPGSPSHSVLATAWRFAPQYAFAHEGFSVSCAQPCLVRSALTRDQGVMELQTVLPANTTVVVSRRGRSTRLKAGEVVVEAEQLRLVGGPGSRLVDIECEHAANAMRLDAKKRRRMRKPMFLVFPLMLALLAQPAHALLDHHDVSATVTGLFLDAATGQESNRALDLMAEEESPTGDWYFVAGHQYSAAMSMTDDGYSRVSQASLYGPNGALLDTATADPPAQVTVQVGC